MSSFVMPSLLAALLLTPGTAVTPGPHQSRNTSSVDLVQVQFVVPARITLGKTFIVRDEVENQGTFLAAQTVTGFYLSLDDTLDDADIVVAGRRVPELAPTQTHGTTTPVTLKTDIKPGTYYLLAVADAKKELEERTRGNNVRAVRVEILPAEQKK